MVYKYTNPLSKSLLMRQYYTIKSWCRNTPKIAVGAIAHRCEIVIDELNGPKIVPTFNMEGCIVGIVKGNSFK